MRSLCLLASLLLLLACNDDAERIRDANDAAARDELSPREVEGAADRINIFDVRTGDCLAEEEDLSDEVDTILVVPCDGPWSFAVLSSFLLDDAEDYPGESVIDAEAVERCDFAMTSTLFPTTASWRIGDRTVNCLLARDAFFVPAVGDCFADELLASDRVDCEAPHLFETFGVFEVTGAMFPGELAIIDTANDGCLTAFERYVGRDYESSEFFYTGIAPTLATFELLGDRTVICYLHTESMSRLRGSMQGSGR